MCGICGIVSLRGQPVDERVLHSMTTALVHRGPDDGGIYTGGSTGFGFRRLSIVDLSDAGHQPMTSADRRYTLVYNGEIYNHRALRAELIARGAIFRSHCDSEVLLHAFSVWGIACLERLHGMFAFAIHDAVSRVTHLARDRFGIKPLYYAVERERLLFSSEIRGLLPFLEHRAPNRQMVFDYLVHDRIDHTDQTFYEGVVRLPAGHWMRIDGDMLTLRCWYRVQDRIEPTAGMRVDEYRDLFFRTVREHAVSEVPIGVSLSGGIDSSSITAALLCGPAARDRIDTFSAVYGRGQVGDESEHIDAFTALGSRSHRVIPDAASLHDDLRRFTRAIGEPAVRTGPYAQFKVMELASRHVKVMLDGQGADEILAGYPNLPGFHYRSLIRSGHLGRLAVELQALLRHRSGATGWQTALLLSLPRDLLSRLTTRRCAFVSAELVDGYSKDSTVPDLFYAGGDLRTALITMTTHKLQHLLKWTDHNSMQFSIESRVPFLDHTLVEATLSLPGHQVIRHGFTKHILREAMRGLVPDSILDRRDKIGFGTPEDNWFRQPALREIFNEALESDVLRHSGFFNIKEMRAIFDRHMTSRGNYARALWKCLNLRVWLSDLEKSRESEPDTHAGRTLAVRA